MKRGLDHIIEGAGKEGKPPLSRQTARALRASLNEALDEIDVPEYKTARSIWRGFSEQLEELKRGQEGFLRKPPELVARELAASSAPDMYRVGAIQAVSDAAYGVGPEGANVAQRFFGARLFGEDRQMLRRLQALITDKSAAEEFADAIAGEVAITQTTGRLGKPGAPRPQAAARVLTPPGVTQRVLQRAGVRSQPSTNQAREIANELTLLFAKGLDDPNELVAMLRSLDAFEQAPRALTAAGRVAAGQAGTASQRERQ
jgi:hypothetical protein